MLQTQSFPKDTREPPRLRYRRRASPLPQPLKIPSIKRHASAARRHRYVPTR